MVVAFKPRQDWDWDKLPEPALICNTEAEEAILGGILLDPEAIGRICDQLIAEAFSLEAHRIIYRAATTLHSQGKPPDLTTVNTWLVDRNLLEEIGGTNKLVQLVDRTVSAVNIDQYAALVIDKWQRRETIKAAQRAAKIAGDTSADISEVRGYLADKLTAIEVPSPRSLRDEIREAIANNPSKSQRQATILKLAIEWKAQPKEIEKLWETIEAEDEQERSRDDVATELDRLLEAKGARLDISQVLPASLAQPIKPLARQMGLRPECYFTTLLATTGTLFPNGTWVRLWNATNFKVTANLYAAIVAAVSQYKSPILDAIATHPLAILQADAKRQYEADMQCYEARLADWEREKKRKDGDPGEKPVKPAQRIYFFDNSTSEGVSAQFAARPEAGLLNLVDELAGKFKSADQYRGGRGSDEEELLSLYDGKGKVSLRASGIKINLPDGLNYGLLGSIQPEVLQGFLKDCKDSNGNWARFVFVTQPKQYALWESDNGSFDLTDRLAGIYRKISRLPARTYTLSLQAKELFRNERNRLEQLRCSDARPAMANYWGKCVGRLGKFALCLHALHSLADGDTCSTEIPAQRMQEAIALNHFYAEQLLSLCGDFEDAEALPPKLAKVLELSVTGTVTLRDVARATKWKTDEVKAVCDELVKLGRGEIVKVGKASAFKNLATVTNCHQTVTSSVTVESLTTKGLQPTVTTVTEKINSSGDTISYPSQSSADPRNQNSPSDRVTLVTVAQNPCPASDSAVTVGVTVPVTLADSVTLAPPDPDPWDAIATQNEATEQEYLEPPQFKVGDRVEEIADPEEGVGVVERFESGRYIVRFLQEPRRVARYDSSELRMAPPDRATLGIVVPPPPPDDSNPKARRLK